MIEFLSYAYDSDIVCGKMHPMLKKGSPLFVILVVLLFCNLLWSQTVYEKSSKTDLPIMSGAIGGLGLGFYLGKSLDPLTQKEVIGLRQQNVLSFDRWACRNFSPKAAKLSDILLNTCVLSPLLMLASSNLDKGQKWTYALMYVETELLTLGITEITKNLAGRIRPYAYNPEVAMQDKIMSSNMRKSFFSGHTSMSFASVAFLAYTYAAIHPDSRWKPVIWGAGLSAATLVGVLRVVSGKHFPTDVLAGALVGSLIGIIIPRLHELDPTTNNSSQKAFRVSFRFSF